MDVDTLLWKEWGLIVIPSHPPPTLSTPFESELDLMTFSRRLRKEKNHKLTVEKPGIHYLNQILKVNLTSDVT